MQYKCLLTDVASQVLKESKRNNIEFRNKKEKDKHSYQVLERHLRTKSQMIFEIQIHAPTNKPRDEIFCKEILAVDFTRTL